MKMTVSFHLDLLEDDHPDKALEYIETHMKEGLHAAMEADNFFGPNISSFWSSLHEERNVWEFYMDTGHKHRWRVKDENGRILAVSSQGYSNKQDAKTCAARLGWHPEGA